MAKQNWIWMPHPGHFICAEDCKFFLNTKVGKDYIVSTVGEMLPEEATREMYARTSEPPIELKGIGDGRKRDFIRKHGYVEVGCDRLYETMVFKAMESKNACCPWRVNVMDGEVDFAGYKTAVDAYKGHLALCKKWDKK